MNFSTLRAQLGRHVIQFSVGVIVSIALLSLFVSYVFLPPKNFEKGTAINIPQGAGLKDVSQDLEQAHIVNSAFWFQFFVLLFGDEKKVPAGEYYFPNAKSTIAVVKMFTDGQNNNDTIKVTIPEGLSLKEMAMILAEKLPLFNTEEFIKTAKEGYLFPDTYFFLPNTRDADVISIMSWTFKQKTANAQAEAITTHKNFDDIVKMASILEKEANNSVDRKIVSGILWRRIKLGIPLQVDVSFVYILGKGTNQLTIDDLKFDSPYNSYTHRGLPPTPIGNPGLESIEAALHPTPNKYLYFLSDNKGIMHYSETFAEHVAAKIKYL